MVMRTVLGDGPTALVPPLPHAIHVSQLVMAGMRDLDPPERSFLDAALIQPWASSAVGDGSLLAALRTHDARQWHIHFDLDVLDPNDFPEVAVPAQGGCSLATVTGFLEEMVSELDVVSMSITEHVGGEASARRIADLVEALHSAGWR